MLSPPTLTPLVKEYKTNFRSLHRWQFFQDHLQRQYLCSCSVTCPFLEPSQTPIIILPNDLKHFDIVSLLLVSPSVWAQRLAQRGSRNMYWLIKPIIDCGPIINEPSETMWPYFNFLQNTPCPYPYWVQLWIEHGIMFWKEKNDSVKDSCILVEFYTYIFWSIQELMFLHTYFIPYIPDLSTFLWGKNIPSFFWYI